MQQQQPTLLDRCHQWIYRVGYPLQLCLNFLLRPNIEGVYVAIWYKQQILIIRNSYKSYHTLPCGRIDSGETALQAGIREVAEEVAIPLQPDQLHFVGNYLNYTEYKRDHIHLFSVTLSDRIEPTADLREVIAAEYMTVQQALQLPLFAPVRTYLQQHAGAESNLSGAENE